MSVRYDRGMADDCSVVLDTNVFVAAEFNTMSDSARILDAVRRGTLRMIWNSATQQETRSILEKIPPLSWEAVADLFRQEYRVEAKARPFSQIPDPEDRKFARLAHAGGAILISQDAHLLVLSPSEFLSGSWKTF